MITMDVSPGGEDINGERISMDADSRLQREDVMRDSERERSGGKGGLERRRSRECSVTGRNDIDRYLYSIYTHKNMLVTGYVDMMIKPCGCG
jgi:hypothetical protein